MSKIIVIGSSNTDMVVKTNKFPMPGETVMGGEFYMFSGGKGANQAVAAARMGGDVTFICKIGDDIFGQRSVEEFEKEGINTRYIEKDFEKASGTALILVNDNGENEIVVASGANERLAASDIEAAEKAFVEADVVLLQLEIPVDSVLYAARKGFEHGKKVILNPAPARQLPNELFGYLYLITPNETEAALLTGITVEDGVTASKAAEIFLSKGIQNVIITLGKKGAYFQNSNIKLMIDAPIVQAMDTTAAGDTFSGAITVALTEGKDWESAIKFAIEAASISVTRMGAQASVPYRNEIV